MKQTLFKISLILCLCLAVSACQPKIAGLSGRYSLSDSYTLILDFLPDGRYFFNDHENAYLTAGSYTLENDRLTVIEKNGSCAETPGTYTFVQTDRNLKFKEVSDPCPQRLLLLTRFGFIKLRQQNTYAVNLSEIPIENVNYIAVDADKNIYITDGHSSASRYDPAGSLLASWGELAHSNGITLDVEGNIYVASFDNLSIVKFDPDGKKLAAWKVDSKTLGPSDVGVDQDGNIYVVLKREQDHYVEKYSPDGKLIASWAGNGKNNGQVSGTFSASPFQIAVDKAGNNYITDPDNNRVVKFDANGVFKQNLTGDSDRQLVQPRYVAVDASGMVIVLDDSQTIWKFDQNGKAAGKWSATYWGPIALDPDGNLLVADWRLVAKIQAPK